jgi:hypothetical protein
MPEHQPEEIPAAERTVVVNPQEAIKIDIPAPEIARPAGPTDGQAEAIREIQKTALEDREFFDKLWSFAEDLRPSEADIRKLKWIVQAMCKRFRDKSEAMTKLEMMSPDPKPSGKKK